MRNEMKIYIDESLPESCSKCGFLVRCCECEGYENICPFIGEVGYDPSDDLKEDAPITPTGKRHEECPLEQMIRCKDCEYYRTPEKYSYKEPNLYCCRSALMKVSENDFCSKAIRKGGEDMPKSPSQDCMKRGEQVGEWIMQGMKEADEWIKENGKNPYADILLEEEGDPNEN